LWVSFTFCLRIYSEKVNFLHGMFLLIQ
jgi:hypothetical protein